jgi:hypothetical protein
MLAVPISFITQDLRFIEKQDQTLTVLLDRRLERLEELFHHVLFALIGAWRMRKREFAPREAERPRVPNRVPDCCTETVNS